MRTHALRVLLQLLSDLPAGICGSSTVLQSHRPVFCQKFLPPDFLHLKTFSVPCRQRQMCTHRRSIPFICQCCPVCIYRLAFSSMLLAITTTCSDKNQVPRTPLLSTDTTLNHHPFSPQPLVQPLSSFPCFYSSNPFSNRAARVSLKNMYLIISFSFCGSCDTHRLQTVCFCPANLSDLILLHPPPTHFLMFLECSSFVPIPGPLFLAPGIISPRSSRSWLLPIQLPASVSTPFKRLLCAQACRMAFQSSPLISWLHFSSVYSSIPNVCQLSASLYQTLSSGKAEDLFVFLNTPSPECRQVARSLWVP